MERQWRRMKLQWWLYLRDCLEDSSGSLCSETRIRFLGNLDMRTYTFMAVYGCFCLGLLHASACSHPRTKREKADARCLALPRNCLPFRILFVTRSQWERFLTISCPFTSRHLTSPQYSCTCWTRHSLTNKWMYEKNRIYLCHIFINFRNKWNQGQ